MTDTYNRKVPMASAPNLRDLGGLPTATGSLKRGQVYRSATLSTLTAFDLALLTSLGIGTVFDLRTADESAAAPDLLPAGTQRVALDVLADSSNSVAASLGEFSTNPQAFADSLSGGRAERLFEETYRDFVRLPSALSSYRSFYLGLIDADRHGAALFHCTTGKDRTGWAAASLLLLLGVSEHVVYEDYLQTNSDLLPALEPLLGQAEAQGIDREVLLPVLGVRESYLAAALESMNEQFGGIQEYASHGLGLSAADVRRLQVLLTE